MEEFGVQYNGRTNSPRCHVHGFQTPRSGAVLPFEQTSDISPITIPSFFFFFFF